MSLQRSKPQEIPEATQRIAKRVFRKPTAIMVLRDQLGPLYQDADFTDLYPRVGQPGLTPAMLALVTVYQYMEDLSDRAVADAVRARIDLKYALGLELDDLGFDASVLAEFRARLVAGDAPTLLLERILAICKTYGLVKGGGQQRTDSTHMVGAVRLLNQLELVMETLRHTLNRLAELAPAWVLARLPPAWGVRYGARASDFRLPKDASKRLALATQVGEDGAQLLTWLRADWVPTPLQPTPIWELAEVEALRQIWVQQFVWAAGTPQLRASDQLPPAGELILSPYDVALRFSRKRSTTWFGMMAHVTETCDADLPHLITHVIATPSTQRDQSVLPTIQGDLLAQDLAPGIHLADSGYMSAANLLHAQDHQIDLVGPVQVDTHWQATDADSYDLTAFHIDWEAGVATCPQGRQSCVWSQSRRKGEPVIRIQFNLADCQACPARIHCTTAETKGRSLQLHTQSQHEALQTARVRQQEPGFGYRYRIRAGIEGTIAQAVRKSGLRTARYVGLVKTDLQLNLTAAALNCLRLAAWFCPNYQRAAPRLGRFACLMRSSDALSCATAVAI